MLPGLSFNGIHSNTFGLTIIEIKLPSRPKKKDNNIQIPERDGSYYIPGSSDDCLSEATMFFVADSIEEADARMGDIISWLATSENTPIIFDKKPGKYYMGHVDNEIIPIPKGLKIEFTVIFRCEPHPFSVTEYTTNLFPNVVNTVVNSGKEKTFPLILATFSQPSTFLALVNSDKHIFLGLNETVDQTPVTKEERVLWDDMVSPTSWTTASNVDDGVIAGTFAFSGYSFYCTDYGSGPRFHGPSLKRSIPGNLQLQDFRAEVEFQLECNAGTQVGRLELYLLDVNGAVIARIHLRDGQTQQELTWADIRIGPSANPYQIVGTYGQIKGQWIRSKMAMHLSREGNLWSAYIAKIGADGKHTAIYEAKWRDTGNKYTGKVAQVQIHIGSCGTYPIVPTMQIHDVKVYRINAYSPDLQVPHIVEAGDIIEINCSTADVRKNGKPFLYVWDPSGDFFPLDPGGNKITYAPDSTTVVMTYRERGF